MVKAPEHVSCSSEQSGTFSSCISNLSARQTCVARIQTKDNEFPSLIELTHCAENLSNQTVCYTDPCRFCKALMEVTL
jgi:hypothetical protein